MTKAAAAYFCVWCGGEKNVFCIFSILMFGKEVVCLDCLFVPTIFQELGFYLNSVKYANTQKNF